MILPLLPGFEGDVAGSTGNALRLITHWNYASICRYKLKSILNNSILIMSGIDNLDLN